MLRKVGPIGAHALVPFFAPPDQVLGRTHRELVVNTKVVKGFEPSNRIAYPHDELGFWKKRSIVAECKVYLQITRALDPNKPIRVVFFV
mmetsp:Transcript_21756/g.53948  ORF Transcript_21756/g.53948 Transcript_21756/m.53948 type:complete len:89 (+) Transcript_21756:464-730(+)